MANPNATTLIVQAWEHALRTTEDIFGAPSVISEYFGLVPRRSYRERLDRERINIYGEVIPRIEHVRRNLRWLGNIRLDPSRLR